MCGGIHPSEMLLLWCCPGKSNSNMQISEVAKWFLNYLSKLRFVCFSNNVPGLEESWKLGA